MAPRLVQWEKRPPVPVATLAEFEQLLDKLIAETPSERPITVILESPSGDALGMGIGREVSVLGFLPGSGNPPYLASVGDESATGSIVFCTFGEWTDFPCRRAIPLELARLAMREFFETGELSKRVKWEEV